MKKILILILVPFLSHAQKITENKKDDMTGNVIIRTSKERITGGMSPKWIKAGVTKVNNTLFLEATVSMSGTFFIVREGGEAIIKMSNDSTVTIKSISMESAHDGMGGKQADLRFALAEPGLGGLQKNSISKIRIYTSEGYQDFEIPEKNKDIVKKEIQLITEAK
jgi:hypothetical protein